MECSGAVTPRLASLNLWQLDPDFAAGLKEPELDHLVERLHGHARNPVELKVDLSPAIYENPQARSLATLVSEIRPARDDLDAARQLLHADRPVRELAFVVAPQGRSHDLDLTQARHFASGTARLSAYRADDITLTTNTPGDAFLVLAVTKCRGWSATIDGKTVPIHQVDGPLMGVAVPAGDHQIHFHFRPVLRTIGLWLAATTLSGACTLVLLAAWRRKRAKLQESGDRGQGSGDRSQASRPLTPVP